MHSVKTKYDNFALKRWLLQVGPVRRSAILRKLKSDLERFGLSRGTVRRGLLQLTSRPRVFLGEPLIRNTNGYRKASESSKQSIKKGSVPNERYFLQSFPNEEFPSRQIENCIEKIVTKISITSKRIEGMKKLKQIPELVAENVGSAISLPMSITSKSIKLNLNSFVSRRTREGKDPCVRLNTEIRKADSSVPDIYVRVSIPNMDKREKIHAEPTRVKDTIEKSQEQKQQAANHAESVDDNVKSNDTTNVNNVPRYLCAIDRSKVQIEERKKEINKRERERGRRRTDEETKKMKGRTLDETLKKDVTFSIKRKKKERSRKRKHEKLKQIFGEDFILSEEDEDEVKMKKKQKEKAVLEENRDLGVSKGTEKKDFSRLALSKDTENILPDSTQIKCDKENSKVIKDDETKEVSVVPRSRVETIQAETVSMLKDKNLKKDQFVTFVRDKDASAVKVDTANARDTLEYESKVTSPMMETDATDRPNCTLPDSSTGSSGEELVKSVQNISGSTSPILGKNKKTKKCVHGRSKESTRQRKKRKNVSESRVISDSLSLESKSLTDAFRRRMMENRNKIFSYFTKKLFNTFMVSEDKEKNSAAARPDSSIEGTDSCDRVKASPIHRETMKKSTLESNCITTTISPEMQNNETEVETSEELTKLLHMNLEEHQITLEGNTISIHESTEINTAKDISTKDIVERSTAKDYVETGSVLLTSSHGTVNENAYDNQMVSIPLNSPKSAVEKEHVQNDMEKELENSHATGSSPYVSSSGLDECEQSESVDKLTNIVQDCNGSLSQIGGSPCISSGLAECEQDEERKDKSIASTKESNVSPETNSSIYVSCPDVRECKKDECKDKSVATSKECNSNSTYNVSCLDLGISECKDKSVATAEPCSKVPSLPRLRVRHPRELGSRWCLTPTPTAPQNVNQVPNVESSFNSNLSYSMNVERVQTALDNIFLSIMCSRRFIERQQIANRLSVQRIRQEEMLQAQQDYESKVLLLRKELNNLREMLKSWSYHHTIMYIVAALNKRMLAGIRPFTIEELYMILNINSRSPSESVTSNYMCQSNTFGGLLSINSNYQHVQFVPNGPFTPTVNASVIAQTRIFSEKQINILRNQIYLYRHLSYLLQNQLQRQGGVQSHKLPRNKHQTVIVQSKSSDNNQRVPEQLPNQIKTVPITNEYIPNFDVLTSNPIVRKEQINKVGSESSSNSDIEILGSKTIENKVNEEKSQEDTNFMITSCENTEVQEIEVIFVRDSVVGNVEPKVSSTEHMKRTSTPEMKNVKSIGCNENVVVPNILEVRTISSNQFDNMEEATVSMPSNLVVDEDNGENEINDENSSKANVKELQEAKACLCCGQPSNVLCGVCVEAHYCSKICQELHWEAEHYSTCNPNPFFCSLSPEPSSSSSSYPHSPTENLQFKNDTQ